MAQLVWNIVIDLYKSTRICLEWDPRTIGIACYELTCKHLKKEVGANAHLHHTLEKNSTRNQKLAPVSLRMIENGA
jgi:hypothetical protein